MANEMSNTERMCAILDYWIQHNREHSRENEKWHRKAEELGFKAVASEFEKVIEASNKNIHLIEHARERLFSGELPAGKTEAELASEEQHILHLHSVPHRHIELHQIGIIRTPYPSGSSFEAMQEERGDCRIIVDERFTEGLFKLTTFSYIIVLFYLDQTAGQVSMSASPPWASGVTVGVFASRSPHRPNPIGKCITAVKGTEGNVITTGRIDAYDGTPLLDIKPYIEKIDSRPGAGNGWMGEFE